ncbi:cell envelope integrity protein TolA [Bowmanella yangjiangensis]|uniref:Cell envelope integrity protein TolA n=1 Tax=Bowmanella yangjiangensis TaxID=2811230 RepID=A0ABS3CSF4_9ALTE|nr:cell envelope integrity protein TolA [Bowmanella yangjiangensis]MBN7819091.1 cell envelope integrity protein TolA [Bowmanella yangjiangensis]
MDKLKISLWKSVALHLVLVVLLAVSVNFHTPMPTPDLPQVNVVQAVAIDRAVIDAQAKRIQDKKDAEKRAEQQRLADIERKAREAEKERQQEKERARQLELDKKRKADEKRKAEAAAAEAKRKQAEEKKRAEQAEAERKRKEQERLKAEKAAKEKREREKKAEDERKRREAQERAEMERQMQEQLQAEQAAQQRRRSQQVLTELQKYTALIKQTIQRNLIVDQSMKGKSCRLNIRLASNGLVTQVRVLNGDAILCRAAQTAVYKAETLPVSPEPDVYEKLRDINLTVEPNL